jgi:hypothetical protein
MIRTRRSRYVTTADQCSPENSAHHQPARLTDGTSWHLDALRVVPQRLRLHEVTIPESPSSCCACERREAGHDGGPPMVVHVAHLASNGSQTCPRPVFEFDPGQ